MNCRNWFPLLFIVSFAITVVCCSPTHETAGQNQAANTISRLQFLSEYDVPYNQAFKGTTIGGLSGIDYDSVKNQYYLISDDRSAINPARYYTAQLHISDNRLDSVSFINVTTLLQPNGTAYPNSNNDPRYAPDPEAIRYNPVQNQIVWSSEGERIVDQNHTVLQDPAITIINPGGTYIDTFLLPPQLHMQATGNGPRRNGVFEGLAFAGNYQNLFVSVEEPLYDDGPRAGTGDSSAWIRIIKYNVATRRPEAQYAYKIEPVTYAPTPADAFKVNGVSDIVAMDDDKLLVMERSYATGRISCVVKVFIADISAFGSLQKQSSFTPVNKKLLLNMESLGRFIDNIEGVTFGPTLKNGHRTLLFVADNNFSPLEKTQFFLFEVIP